MQINGERFLQKLNSNINSKLHLMKKLFPGLLILLLCLSGNLQAKIKFGKQEHIKTVAEMPRTEEFLLNDIALVGDNNKELKIDNKDFINLGIKYTTYNFAGMPYWVSEEPKFVGTSSFRKDMYYDITPEEANYMLKKANMTREEALKLNFFDKYLGWVVSLVLLAGVVIYYMYFTKDEEKKDGYYDNGDVIKEKTEPKS